jgi:RNA polymerase sigma-70 factor (ECF subfamily)
MDATLDLDARDEVAGRLEDRDAVERSLVDANAFTVLYRKYVTDIYRYCYRRLQDREASEDVTSQIFMQAYAGLPSLGARPFRPWLFAIARNAMIDRYRRQRPPELPLDGLPDRSDNAVSPEDQIVDRESADAIHQLFDQLSERDRQIVELRLAGLSGVEIAEAMHCSHAVVRTAQHRAFERIRAMLADRQPEGRLS